MDYLEICPNDAPAGDYKERYNFYEVEGKGIVAYHPDVSVADWLNVKGHQVTFLGQVVPGVGFIPEEK